MKKILTLLLAGILISLTGKTQPQPFYKEVDLIIWIVSDVQKVADGWESVGFSSITDHGQIAAQDLKYKGNLNDSEIHLASALLGGAQILWIQPVNGNNAFSRFLKKNGDGVFSLVHSVPSQANLNMEINRLTNLGVPVLQTCRLMIDNKSLDLTFMQTDTDGKYCLGYVEPHDMLFEENANNNALNMIFSQFAFAIKPGSVEKVSGYWEKLGFPPMEVTHGETWGKEYYGVPSDFDMELGWHRFGKIVYEWCIPLKPPTVYEDHIKKYGEGFQHFGFRVEDMDQAIDFFEDKDYKVSMSGGWGEKGKPGSGRFAYVDLEGIGGETIELLWSFKN